MAAKLGVDVVWAPVNGFCGIEDTPHDLNETYKDEWALGAARLAYATGGVDAFHISDDWGGTGGLLISPDQFREFFLKPFEKLVAGFKSFGVPVIMHNDGNLWDILDDLVNTGIDAYHPVEKAATMDLVTVKQKYKGRICPIGNVNNKTTMVTGTPEDVINETLECLKSGAPGVRFIISTDHSLHDGIPLENAMALIETVHKFGKYPLET
jgi:uroporphyrinogen decarboxylase